MVYAMSSLNKSVGKFEKDGVPMLDESKSKLKRDNLALKKLGVFLVDLPKEKIKSLEISTDIKEAIFHYKNINSFQAKKRQLQFINKKIRLLDEIEQKKLKEIISGLKGESLSEKKFFRSLERKRDRLLKFDCELTKFFLKNPEINIQYFRSLIRNIKKNDSKEKISKANKELFKTLEKCELKKNINS
tara:strand:+ start:1394 stop:1957 length:564 start_codon:yes stop_codon:yes gene_type:complete